MVKAYYERLTGTDEKVRAEAGRAWVRSSRSLPPTAPAKSLAIQSRWEMATSRLHVDPDYISKADAPGFADAFARIGALVSLVPTTPSLTLLIHREPLFRQRRIHA